MNYRFLWTSEAQDVTGNKQILERERLSSLLIFSLGLQISVYARRVVCTYTQTHAQAHRHTCVDTQTYMHAFIL